MELFTFLVSIDSMGMSLGSYNPKIYNLGHHPLNQSHPLISHGTSLLASKEKIHLY